jgi:hypothetical protein
METTSAVQAGQVDPEAVERLREQEAAARAAGFALAPPVYALGTRVVGLGAENFRRSRQRFEALPMAQDALSGLVARVAAERRQDTVVPVAMVRMADDGRIGRADGGRPFLLSRDALRQLVERTDCPVPAAAATYLAEVTPARRAREMNAWLAATSEGATMKVRHRETLAGPAAGTLREVYAVVSERYASHDVDELAGDFQAALLADLAPGDARAEVEYDGLRAALTLRWHSDIQPETCAAGEVFRAAAGLRTADDGTASITPFAGLDRNLCLNLIIIDEAEVSLGRRRHTGNGVSGFLAGALKEAVDRVRWFAERWDAARNRPLFFRGAGVTVNGLPEALAGRAVSDFTPAEKQEAIRGVFRGLLASGAVTLPGYRATSKVEAQRPVEVLTAAFRKEPEYTVAGVVNAVTRAAHEVPLKGEWAADETQRQGAALLTRKAPLRWVGEEVDF